MTARTKAWTIVYLPMSTYRLDPIVRFRAYFGRFVVLTTGVIIAHGEGPKGFEIEKAYQESLNHLENLLQAAEFLTEYPLIYVEKTRRDTQDELTHYDFRELMGDHHLVPIKSRECPSCELEAESLYLIDRDEQLHLLRPFLIYHQALRENRLVTYYLNRYDPAQDNCELRSLELGDTVELTGISGQFLKNGLIARTKNVRKT